MDNSFWRTPCEVLRPAAGVGEGEQALEVPGVGEGPGLIPGGYEPRGVAGEGALYGTVPGRGLLDMIRDTPTDESAPESDDTDLILGDGSLAEPGKSGESMEP